MATATAPPASLPPSPGSPMLRARPGTGRRRVKSAVATGVIVSTFLIALVPLVLVVVYIVNKGAGIISKDFLTGDIAFSTRSTEGGIGPAAGQLGRGTVHQ